MRKCPFRHFTSFVLMLGMMKNDAYMVCFRSLYIEKSQSRGEAFL